VQTENMKKLDLSDWKAKQARLRGKMRREQVGQARCNESDYRSRLRYFGSAELADGCLI